ncbi:CsgG/HfaB family protein [Deferribacterales bacterium Es71-Z0220]|uniref:CsgG/HfaB family protein n=1 Tax=Deferrivibrio essentukiensis TaxID=2880922 RepID=UPI001F61C21F|nr:CsgG/HfaB family protein [Deferrivibrio essentukiensis]MCB4204686.1 CsgG/HfaB family protein [Deferrivibrio essentukiensis]
MKSLKLLASVLSLSLVLFACAAPKIDPMSMQVTPADTEQVNIPQICMAQYESKKISVAVLPFTNNTTFGKMEGVNTNIQGEATRTHTSAGVAGVVAAPGAVGIGYAGASKTNVKYSKDINTFYRQISPQLGEFAQSAVEDTIVNIGGVNVFSRAQMEKILQEQGFQMNVADPNTVAQFGKIAGVSYVITGTVDNINAKYVPKSDTNTGNVWVNLALAVGKSMVEGWNVTTDMTVQLIDVSTGQILLSKKVSGRELGGTQPGFNPELVVTAAKKAMQESVDDIKPVFSEHFSAKAYINQLRGNKSAAMVSMGRKDGIKPGDKLEAYEFLEVQDFMTKKSNCTKSKIPVELIVSDQVDESTSWVVVEGEPNSKMRLKLGTLVKRAPLSGQSVIKKLW